jgi:hypothetical protein
VQRLLFVVVLAIAVIGFPLLVLSDTSIPTHDADTPNGEIAVNMSETGNSTASVTITITMCTGDAE